MGNMEPDEIRAIKEDPVSGHQPPVDQTAAVIAAFQRATRRVKRYATILAEEGVEADAIRDLAAFATHVPIITKKSYFNAARRISELCVDGQVADLDILYTSSGFSGQNSFGGETAADEAALRQRLDALLDRHFATGQRTTLLINALPAGVRVPTGTATVIDTSTRVTAILAVLKMVDPDFSQTIMVGEQPFLKEVLEQAREDQALALSNRERPLHLITGGEVMPESFRRYAAERLGHDPARPQDGQVLVNLGISEVSLSLGLENETTRRVRRAAYEDRAVRTAAFGHADYVPTLVQYDPSAMYVETIPDEQGRGRLTVTTLDPNRRIPLIRYNTGDWTEVLDETTLRDRLASVGHGELVTPGGGPFIVMWGRGRSLKVKGRSVYPEQVKESLYETGDLAHRLTGNFRLTTSDDTLTVEFQLRPAFEPSDMDGAAVTSRLDVWMPVPTRTVFRGYAEFGGLTLSFQRKFQYLR